ncbi:MAG: hypothetical protein PHH77_07750 [Victivallaceae bacterium]|nr:hypothetical protein [Victivallaceae bacterium]
MLIRLKGDENLVPVDYRKAPISKPIYVMYGFELPIVLEFYHDNGNAFDETELSCYTSFQFGIDSDYDFSTDPAALANSGFEVSENTLSFILLTDSAKFKTLLGNESTANAVAELKCYTSGSTKPKLSVSFDVKLRNAVLADGTGEPSSNPELYITHSEAYALVQEAPVREFSVDGETDWHETQTDDDRYYREQRNSGEWSDAIALIEPTDAFVYVAYASDDAGTDFSLTPSDTLKYRAEIHVTEAIETPTIDDFTGATWVKYLGDTGAQGENAPEVQYQFSVDGETDWHTPWASGDFYQRISVDDGVTWSDPIEFVGANGTGVAPQGTYDSGTTYALNEGVTYNSSYYRSLAENNTGNQPDTSPAYWELMIAKGDTGAQGIPGINILSSITGESFLYPKTGIINPFSNAANSPNIDFDVDNYADTAAMLSTSANEPLQLPKFKVSSGTASLKKRFVYAPESGYGWNGETVVFKGEYKKMTDNAAWGSVTAFDIGTDTVPAAVTPTGDTTNGSAVVTNMSSTDGLFAGMAVSGTGIPADSTIVSVDSATQITLNANATADGSGVTLSCQSLNPQLYEATISLATLGLAVGDIVQMVVFVDSSSTWAHDIALELCEIEVVTS